jgi:uncharacterized protein involved in type VI secretion and phage assembly
MIMTPRSRTTDKRYYGVVEALVTAVEDEGKQGRVKVKFPWFNEEMESEWCRVRQMYAGNGYGAFFIPEVGDEVLVAFIHGDMRLPIILGGLYNGRDKPPTYRASDKDQKLIRTRGKHEILFDDTPNEQRIRIKTQGGHEADLDDKQKQVTIKTSAGQTVELKGQGDKITLSTQAGQTIELDGQGNKITLNTPAGQSIQLDGNSGTITLTGPTTLNLEVTSLSLGGAAATQPLVLGQLFMALFNAHVHNLGPVVTTPPVTPMTPALLSTVSKTV